jgi:Helix-turn-helix domain
MNFAAPKRRESCYNCASMIVQKAYKYRFFPTNSQARQLAQTFGSARFVWNRGLELRTKSYEQEKKSISYTQTAAALTQWKKEPEKPHRLLVLPDAASGWADLGNPDRVIDTLIQNRIEPEWLREMRGSDVPADALINMQREKDKS